jgi:hypothetical protein
VEIASLEWQQIVFDFLVATPNHIQQLISGEQMTRLERFEFALRKKIRIEPLVWPVHNLPDGIQRGLCGRHHNPVGKCHSWGCPLVVLDDVGCDVWVIRNSRPAWRHGDPISLRIAATAVPTRGSRWD